MIVIFRFSAEFCRGSGFLNGDAYQSNAKVLLLGSGADEQLAGYGRHISAFQHRGWNGLNEELHLDTSRIWIRNLGRDDRVIRCSHVRMCDERMLSVQAIMDANQERRFLTNA
jgi:asparagine synthetase B (glutamine-hydrolysing)